jgi:acetyl-CoA carboxylase biotin carboxyl carrier protein
MTKKAGLPSGGSDVFSTSKIRELLELMKEYDLSEIDLMQDDQQIRLARGSTQSPVLVPSPQAMWPGGAATGAAAPPPSLPAAGVSDNSAGSVSSPDGPHVQVIKSPMVGTYYSRPKPGADDFVKVGSKVSPDTVVCIVEAMKVFNEIPAEISGTIVEILVANEESVDFNRPLFKVDTRK